MGRKSNAKKKLREISANPPKKNTPAKSPKTSRIKKKISQINLDITRVIWLFAAIFSILLFIFFLIFTVRKVLGPVPVAKYLPAGNTVFLLEIMMDPHNRQVLYANELLNPKTKELLKKFHDYQTNDDLLKFADRKAAVAMVNFPDRSEMFYFLEIKNSQSFREFFKNLSPDNFAIIDNYLIYAENSQALSGLLEIKNQKKLYSSRKFAHVNDNMPLNKFAFFYLDFANISESALQKLPFISENAITMQMIAPLKKLFNSSGFSLIAHKDQFVLQGFTGMGKNNFFTFDREPHYEANLTGLVKSDVLAYWGGLNLEKHVKRTLKLISAGDQSKYFLLDEFLRNFLKRYLGNAISLEKDLYSLIRDEFALVLEQNGEKYFYTLLFNIQNPQSHLAKIEKIAENFAKVSAIFKPQKVPYTLPDGTETMELVATQEDLTASEILYKNHKIKIFQLDSFNWQVGFTFFDSTAIISTDLLGIKRAIDLNANNAGSLSDSFAAEFARIIGDSDELTYFNISQITAILPPELTDYFSSFQTITTGKNYFYDGITSLSFIK